MPKDSLGEHHPFRSAQDRTRYLSRYDELAEAWPVVSDTTTIESDHGRTLVRSSGPVDRPPLVLLPGVWAHSLQWPIPMIKAFSETYRTHAVDNVVDFGRSVSTRPVKQTPDFMAWLDVLLEALAPSRKVNLLGLSRGGWLAAEYTLHNPRHLESAVWLSPGLVVHRPSLSSVRGGPLSIAAVRRPSSETVDAMMRWLMPECATFDNSAFREYVEDTATGLRCFDTSQVGRTAGPRVFSVSELGSVTVPVLYIAGADEKLTPVRAAVSRLQKAAPQIETAVLTGAGHGLATVRPEEVSRRVLEFLGRAQGLT